MNFGTQLGREYLSSSKLHLCIKRIKVVCQLFSAKEAFLIPVFPPAQPSDFPPPTFRVLTTDGTFQQITGCILERRLEEIFHFYMEVQPLARTCYSW